MGIAEGAIQKHHPAMGLPLDGHPLIPQWSEFVSLGRILIYTGKAEFGQGILSALATIALDALMFPRGSK